MSIDKKERAIAPAIHLNGSGDLEHQYKYALEKAILLIDHIPCPHSRDYYVINDTRYKMAVEQYQDMRSSVQGVIDTFESIIRQMKK